MKTLNRVLSFLEKEAHGVLDRFEDPETMMAQAIRDAETELLQLEQAQESMLASKLALEDEKHQAWALHLQWEARALNAVAAGDELLAQGALAFAVDYRDRHGRLETELSEAELQLQKLRSAAQERRRQIDQLNLRSEELLAKMHIAQVEQLDAGHPLDEERPLDLYARMEAKLKRVIYEAKAAQTLAEERLAAKLDALSSNSSPSQAVRDKLAALKAKLSI